MWILNYYLNTQKDIRLIGLVGEIPFFYCGKMCISDWFFIFIIFIRENS
jgi:hypothetical protein